MTTTLIFAGSGGQGIILAGKILCLAALKEGHKVTHIPSYGVEMRGGTANCSVVISDEDIPSPLVFNPDVACVFNEPSAAKFGPLVKRGGFFIYNSSLITKLPPLKGINMISLKANHLAEETTGSAQAANMVILGALIALKPELARIESLYAALDDGVSITKRTYNEKNKFALLEGYYALKRHKIA